MMILKRELAFHRTSFLIWGSILFLITVLFFGSYAAVKIDENYLQIMEQMPESLKTAFMMDTLNFSDIHGFFAGNSYTYLVIIVGIYTAILSSTMFAKEEDKRTAEFLYTKPVTRWNIFSQKLYSTILSILGINLIVLLGVFLTLWFIIREEYTASIFITLILGQFIASLAICGIGFLISNFTSSEKFGLTVGISFVMLSYVINIMSGIVQQLDGLKYVSFFYYLDPPAVVVAETPWGKYAILISIFILTISIAYLRFKDKDISL